MSSFAITGVQTGPSPADGSVPLRLEIHELQKNADLWNLYLLGLDRLQSVDQSRLLSYYQLSGIKLPCLILSFGVDSRPIGAIRVTDELSAGIHGRPYVAWDKVGPAANGWSNGYCTHTSNLFPTWHRPYLALYEVNFLLRCGFSRSTLTGIHFLSKFSTTRLSRSRPSFKILIFAVNTQPQPQVSVSLTGTGLQLSPRVNLFSQLVSGAQRLSRS